MTRTLTQYIDNSLDKILDTSVQIQIRCTFIQILILIPQVINLDLLVAHLKKTDELESGTLIEVQLILTVVLKLMLRDDFEFTDFSEDSINSIIDCGLNNNSNMKLIEIILNNAKRKGTLGVKLDQLRNSNTSIDWAIIDDYSREPNDMGVSFSSSSNNRLDSIKKLWTEFKNYGQQRTLETSMKEANCWDNDGDLESGISSQKDIFSFKLPLLSEVCFSKYKDE